MSAKLAMNQMECCLSGDTSYWIHTSESDGDLERSWAAVNATQSKLPVEPVVDFRMTLLPSLFIKPEPAVKTSYPTLLTKPNAVDGYTPSLCLINEKDVTNAKSF